MKRLVITLLLLPILLGACASQTTPAPAPVSTPPPLPVLVVDEAHMTTAGLTYQIPAGTGFVLDASGYDFGSSLPTAVQVVTGSRFYQGTWAQDASSQAVLASDLTPLFNAAPLTAFSAGQQLIVSIGTLPSPGRFKPIWVAVIDVK